MNIDLRIQSTMNSKITRCLIEAFNAGAIVRIEDEIFRIVDMQLADSQGTAAAHFALVKV